MNEKFSFDRINFTAMNSEFLLLGEKREEAVQGRIRQDLEMKAATAARSHQREGRPIQWQEELRLWFAYVEKHCSRFLPDSELSRLNGAPKGTPVLLSLTCYEMLEEAWKYAKKTGFYFNPLIARKLEELGYDRSFDQLAKAEALLQEDRGGNPLSPAFDEGKGMGSEKHSLNRDKAIREKEGDIRREGDIDPPPSFFESIDSKSLTFLPGMKAVIRQTDEKIDLGGIGKGWSVDRAAIYMMARGMKAGLVDGGGDLRFWHYPGYLWRIGVEDPLQPGKERLILFLGQGAVATSSKGYRRWKHKGKWVHHLIDGRTGNLSASGILQATVIGRSTTEAEIFSKVLCLLSPEEAIRWGERHFPHLAYLFFDEKNEMHLSSNFDQIVTKAVTF